MIACPHHVPFPMAIEKNINIVRKRVGIGICRVKTTAKQTQYHSFHRFILSLMSAPLSSPLYGYICFSLCLSLFFMSSVASLYLSLLSSLNFSVAVLLPILAIDALCRSSDIFFVAMQLSLNRKCIAFKNQTTINHLQSQNSAFVYSLP